MSDSTDNQVEPETPQETSRIPSNGGWLQVGNPGNKGGGNIASKIRAQLRDQLNQKGVKLISKALDEGDEYTNADKLKAFDLAAKYGLGEVKAFVSEEILQLIAEVGPNFMDEPTYEAFAAEFVERLKGIA